MPHIPTQSCVEHLSLIEVMSHIHCIYRMCECRLPVIPFIWRKIILEVVICRMKNSPDKKYRINEYQNVSSIPADRLWVCSLSFFPFFLFFPVHQNSCAEWHNWLLEARFHNKYSYRLRRATLIFWQTWSLSLSLSLYFSLSLPLSLPSLSLSPSVMCALN